MAQTGENLVVRQHERLSCALRAELRVAAEHVEKVILSAASGETGGILATTLIDLSSGGVGFRSTVFFPKKARLVVRLSAEDSGGTAFETTIRVQRVQMLDRTPTYYIGASFVDEGPGHSASVTALIRTVRAAMAAGGAGSKGVGA